MVYKTMQGQILDMDKLMQKNELTPAVGNAKMNARGDKLGAGGKIVQTREEMVAEYYETNPKAAKKTKLTPTVVEEEPAPVAPKVNKKTQSEE